MEHLDHLIETILNSRAYLDLLRIITERWDYVFWGGMFLGTLAIIAKIARALRRRNGG